MPIIVKSSTPHLLQRSDFILRNEILPGDEIASIAEWFYDCWTTETVDSVMARPSLQMLFDVVVSSDCAGDNVNCRCSMWSRVFSIALKRFSRLVVPRIPTWSWGPSGKIARSHHVHEGPSGRCNQSSSVSGISPKTRWISERCVDGTVSHHSLLFARTC